MVIGSNVTRLAIGTLERGLTDAMTGSLAKLNMDKRDGCKSSGTSMTSSFFPRGEGHHKNREDFRVLAAHTDFP